MSTSEVAARVIEARDAHCTEPYDEVFRDVVDSIRKAGSVGKADIGALLFWKRLRADTRWARDLHQVPDPTVRSATGRARAAALDVSLSVSEAAGAARAHLSELPGFRLGDALASAVIAAAAPSRMAVYDKRAGKALRELGFPLDDRSGRYRRYMAIIEDLLGAIREERPDWTARDVDLGLFILGGDN
jgi:hypothetical protein